MNEKQEVLSFLERLMAIGNKNIWFYSIKSPQDLYQKIIFVESFYGIPQPDSNLFNDSLN
jgi:hypothetical protein